MRALKLVITSKNFYSRLLCFSVLVVGVQCLTSTVAVAGNIESTPVSLSAFLWTNADSAQTLPVKLSKKQLGGGASHQSYDPPPDIGEPKQGGSSQGSGTR